MKKNSLKLFMLLFIGCCSTSIFYSCFKDEVSKSHMVETEMVKFKTLEEYNEALNTVLSMSKDERKSYEESKGYISFGRKCDEFYDEIDFDKFESLEEIKAFAASNDFIVLYEDDDGEFILETMLSSKRDRYFINSDRLFQIGDHVYKVFEDGTASTHIDNLYKLTQIESFSINAIPEDVEVLVSNTSRNFSLKDAAWDCGWYGYGAKSEGKYRIGIGVELDKSDYLDGHIPYTLLKASGYIRSFRKGTFTWVYSNRWVAYSSKVAIDLDSPTGWTRNVYQKNGEHSIDGKFDYVYLNAILSYGLPYYYGVHYGGFDCTATMVNEGVEAKLACNKHILTGY
jgi:hypothetical protein